MVHVGKRGRIVQNDILLGSHENPTKVKFILKTNVFFEFLFGSLARNRQ